MAFQLSCDYCVGPFGPWLSGRWQRQRTKAPERGGVPEVGARVDFLSGPHGRAFLLADSEARPTTVTAPVAPAAWDPQG